MTRGPMWDSGKPIINSMLEQDVYKFLMLYFIWRFYPNLRVRWRFTNRTKKIPLGQFVDIGALREEYEHARSLRMNDDELEHIRSWRIFPEPFLAFLKDAKLFPEIHVQKTPDGQLSIEAEGLWLETTFCEMLVLPIMSELYTRSVVGESVLGQERTFKEAERRNDEKIAFLKQYPMPFSQFGMRRRATGKYEQYVTERFLREAPGCITGISNVFLAWLLGVEARGTNAHELYMALYALYRHIKDEVARLVQYDVLDKWEKCFGNMLLIFLPDTFGSPQFFAGLTKEHAIHWKGFRQDSGDPIAFGEKLMIPFYQKHGVDPRGKLLIPSDGLDFKKMKTIYDHFAGRLMVSFGLGTHFTNDIGFEALSLVMKLVEAAGRPAVKLSDNIAKAIGPREEIEEAKRIFGYNESFYEECRY